MLSDLRHLGLLYLIDQGYLAGLLHETDTPPIADWRRMLASDLRRPRLLLSWLKATRVRLRRSYLMILYFVTAAWITKLTASEMVIK